MTIPPRIGSGPRARAKTVSITMLRNTLDNLTYALKGFSRAGYIFVKVNSQNIEILPVARKDEANVLLNVSAYDHVTEDLPSERARNILIFRGHQSVFLISNIEKPARIEPGLGKYVKDMVLAANQNIVNSIISELQTPRLVTRSRHTAEWCENSRRWAEANDPDGKVIRVLDNGNILIMAPDAPSTERLSNLYKKLADDFRREKIFRLPPPTDLERARTAFQDVRPPFGAVIATENIITVQEKIKANPGIRRIDLTASISDGSIAFAENEKFSNIALSLNIHSIKILFGISLPITLVEGVFFDPIMFDPHFIHPSLRDRVNVPQFFTEMVREINNEQGRDFIETAKKHMGSRVNDQMLSLLNETVASLKSGEFAIRMWIKKA